MRHNIWFVIWATVVLVVDCAYAASGKCLHCKAVGAELHRRLENERPKNHIDLRHRLDSEGKRYGKVIDYKVSELRAVELLDDICGAFGQYEMVYLRANETETGESGWQWVKTKGEGAIAVKSAFEIEKAELKQRQRDLEHYCGRLMEDFEDDISEALFKGQLQEIGVAEFICTKLTKVCKVEQPAGDEGSSIEAGSKEEL